MKTRKWLAYRWGAGAIAVALAASPLVAGLAGAGSVAAEAPSYPLISAAGAQVGLVEFDGFGSLQQFAITLAGARPDTTYVVADCGTNADGTSGCVSDATQDTITTDALGNAQKVVNVSDGPVTTEITLTDTADSTDTATGGPNVIATSLMAPVIIVAPSTLP